MSPSQHTRMRFPCWYTPRTSEFPRCCHFRFLATVREEDAPLPLVVKEGALPMAVQEEGAELPATTKEDVFPAAAQ